MSVRETSIAITGQNPQMASQLAGPKSGDVLVSRPTARADVYWINVIATGAHMSAVRYDDAMEKAREVARGLSVDGWYTCDHIHSVRIARHGTSIERSVRGTMPSRIY